MGARGEQNAAAPVRAFEPRSVALAALLVGALLAYRALIGYDPDADARAALHGAEEVLFSPTGSSPQIVFAALLWILWQRSSRILGTFLEQPLPLVGVPLLLVAGVLLLWSHYTGATDLAVLSLSFAFLGAGAWLGGRRGFVALLVPALFLLLLIPLPPALSNAILFDMQMLTVRLAKASLDLLGFPAVVEGDQIWAGKGVFHVIESCAGFRILMTLLMSSILYCELFHLPRRRALALFLLTPLLSIAINNLRVLSIVFNPYSKFAAVHTLQGLVMIALGVFAIALTDSLLARVLPDATQRRRVGARTNEFPVARVAALAAFFVVLAGAQWATPPWTPPPKSPAWTLSNLPLRHGSWNSEAKIADRDFLGSVGFTERSFRRFTDGSQSVDVFIGVDDHVKRSLSLVSDKNRYPGAGFGIVEQGDFVPIGGIQVERLVVSSRGRRQLVYYWTEGVQPLGSEALRSFLALDRSPFRHPERSTVVRLATPLGESSADAAAAAEARLASFVPYVREGLDGLDRAAAQGAADGAGAPH
jgi:EpsI family protein